MARSAASSDSDRPLPHVISDQTSCLWPKRVFLFSLMMVPTSVLVPPLTNALKESDTEKQVVDRASPGRKGHQMPPLPERSFVFLALDAIQTPTRI